MMSPLSISTEFVSVQPMMEPNGTIFYLDFVGYPSQLEFPFMKRMEEDLINNASPWCYRSDRFEHGTWIADYNRDVYEMKYSTEGFEIVRVWKHQLKKWCSPVATDYGELRKASTYPADHVRWLRKKANEPPVEIGKFDKWVLPMIKRTFSDVKPNWFETSHVTKPADKIPYKEMLGYNPKYER